jgi:hypothetical protein
MPAYRGESGVRAASEKPKPLMQKMTSARYSVELVDRAEGTVNATMAAYAKARIVAMTAELR